MYVIANKADQEANEKVDAVGITCGYERLMEKAPVPQLESDDTIAFLNTGSYIEPTPVTSMVCHDRAWCWSVGIRPTG